MSPTIHSRLISVWVTAVLAIVVATGCAPLQVKVKDATNDKMGYLDKNFAVKNIPKSVVSTVTTADAEPMNFKKIVITQVTEQELATQTGAKPEFRTTTTFVNVGGPFTQEAYESSSNNIPYSIGYALLYRGLFALRSQNMLLSHVMSGPMFEVKAIKLSGWTPGKSGTLVIEDEEGSISQLADYLKRKLACQFSDVFPASQVHKRFSGSAQMLDCELSNSNGAVTSRSKQVLLMEYGLVVATRGEGADFNNNFKVVDVEIQ